MRSSAFRSEREKSNSNKLKLFFDKTDDIFVSWGDEDERTRKRIKVY